MKIDIENDLLKAYKKEGGKNGQMIEAIKSGDSTWMRTQSFHSDAVSVEDLELLIKLVNANLKFRDQPSKRQELRRYKAVLNLKKGAVDKIINVEVMCTALRSYLKPLQRHWLFHEHDGFLVPWFIERIIYHPPETRQGYYHPAFGEFKMKAKRRGKEVTRDVSFERAELGNGSSPAKLLQVLELWPESEDLIENYEEEMIVYRKYSVMTGEQFLVQGTGTIETEGESRSHWNIGTVNFSKDGLQSRAIMDDEVAYGSERRGKKGAEEQVYADSFFWRLKKGEEDEDEDVEQAEVNSAPIPVPEHPFVCLFSLSSHEFATTHINNLDLYRYDETLADKLILPPDHRSLINVLIGTAAKNSDDLVRGKKGGVVILCSGPPGTGKTLTAEIYSEVAKRPLYMVQCSQLGVDSEELEEELGTVLRRSVRWNAILLIDEADVYIHERGEDINQNAVVGVFLRLLEYYSGVLFMTTNRATVTDDAIRSRCMAHIHYGVVTEDKDKIKLWKTLSTQYQIKLADETISWLIRLFPELSGRTIKQFCRLAQAMAKDGEADAKLFLWLAQFQTNECVIDPEAHAKFEKTFPSK